MGNTCTTVWFPLSYFCYAPERDPKAAISASPMRHLPLELYQAICQLQDLKDFSRLSRVCQLFRERMIPTYLQHPSLLGDALSKIRMRTEVLDLFLKRFPNTAAPYKQQLSIAIGSYFGLLSEDFFRQVQAKFPELVTLRFPDGINLRISPKDRVSQMSFENLLTQCPKVQTFVDSDGKALSREQVEERLLLAKETASILDDHVPIITYAVAPPPPPPPFPPPPIDFDKLFKFPKLPRIVFDKPKIDDIKLLRALLNQPQIEIQTIKLPPLHFPPFTLLQVLEEQPQIPPAPQEESRSPLDHIISAVTDIWKKLFS